MISGRSPHSPLVSTETFPNEVISHLLNALLSKLTLLRYGAWFNQAPGMMPLFPYFFGRGKPFQQTLEVARFRKADFRNILERNSFGFFGNIAKFDHV